MDETLSSTAEVALAFSQRLSTCPGEEFNGIFKTLKFKPQNLHFFF